VDLTTETEVKPQLPTKNNRIQNAEVS